ncbi:ferritin-like domain-containing protein [Massilia sp. TS11]|uniref:ferritin-like domain-containing protein n=1 Tax=Massilia sp. TS11 TaxID=2908003 RepID=UPI001EDB6A72|nr:ferritin-like domain-containing protein [Massilia sp. TS11]MCG2586780.1 ferritin-like domain-containing protein [Massilia sp. TS11]
METEHLGLNRTGIQMSPFDSKAMQELEPQTAVTDGRQAGYDARAPYYTEGDALGSVPVPGTIKGMMTTGMTVLKGENPQLLLDKLGERLAVERSGTRLYDALIAKCRAKLQGSDISMTLAELEHIRDEEHHHMQLVADAIESLGGDPTTQTPCADVAGVETLGLMQVISDPRTTVAQSLHAVLVGELTDNAGWEQLVALCDAQGLDELVDQFAAALETEREHLAMVKTWLDECVGLSYGDVELDAEENRGAAPLA